jgi:hypothetical protein
VSSQAPRELKGEYSSARDASNNPVSNYSGTVRFTSSDSAAFLPQNSTLTKRQ